MSLADFANVHTSTKVDIIGGDDIRLQRVGDRQSVGKPFRGDDPATPVNTILITLTSGGRDHLNPAYLYYMLESLHMQGYFSRLAKGTAQQFITVADVEDIPIRLG
jgi:restriction endonuclease S subunit